MSETEWLRNTHSFKCFVAFGIYKRKIGIIFIVISYSKTNIVTIIFYNCMSSKDLGQICPKIEVPAISIKMIIKNDL